MTDYERRRLEQEVQLEHLSQLLQDAGMQSLAYDHRRWRCTAGHDLQHYRHLRVGKHCPLYGCAGHVEHYPLSWFTVPDVLWALARRNYWTVALTMHEGGAWYQWEIFGQAISKAENQWDAALDLLIQVLGKGDADENR